MLLSLAFLPQPGNVKGVLAYFDHAGLNVVRLPSRTVTRISDIRDGDWSDVQVSPDGKFVLFMGAKDGKVDVYLADVGKPEIEAELVEWPYKQGRPTSVFWGADPARFVVDHEVAESGSLATVFDRETLEPVAEHKPAGPAFMASADGMARFEAGNGEISYITALGSKPIHTWKGKNLANWSTLGASEFSNHFYVEGKAGSYVLTPRREAVKVSTPGQKLGDEWGSPSFSPDGKWLALHSYDVAQGLGTEHYMSVFDLGLGKSVRFFGWDQGYSKPWNFELLGWTADSKSLLAVKPHPHFRVVLIQPGVEPKLLFEGKGVIDNYTWRPLR